MILELINIIKKLLNLNKYIVNSNLKSVVTYGRKATQSISIWPLAQKLNIQMQITHDRYH